MKHEHEGGDHGIKVPCGTVFVTDTDSRWGKWCEKWSALYKIAILKFKLALARKLTAMVTWLAK